METQLQTKTIDFTKLRLPTIEEIDKSIAEDSLTLSDWCSKTPVILDGNNFSFKRHEYLIDPYQDTHNCIIEEKAAQMGLTSKAMLSALYGARYKGYRGILYLFPSKSDVLDFSKGRITPLIDDNPDTIGSWLRDTDAAGIKEIWNSFLYLRGMQSKIGLKCHDDKTEVLTHSGWKFFSEIDLCDELATRSPSGQFMWQSPLEIYSYEHMGTMLRFKENGFDACVTPNHRMLLTKTDKPDFEWMDIAENAKTVPHSAIVRTSKGWKGIIPEDVIIDGRDEKGMKRFIILPGNKKNSGWESFGRNPERRIRLSDFVAFLGLYVAEGCCSGVKSGKRDFGRVHISQEKKSKHFNEIESLLKRIPLNWKYNGHCFRAGDMAMADILFPFGNKYTKSLPDWVLDLPTKYLEILWEWAVKGDGHKTESGYTNYATVSKKLADQFQEILQKCGRSASILVQKSYGKHSVKNGREIKETTPCYLVSERRSRCSVVPVPEVTYYNGKVYCAAVPNGTLYTRRNGYAMWSGNSIPVDYIIFDELDEAPQNAIDMAMERMSHSEFKKVLKLSNPTLPDYGIDRAFQETDQRYWLLKCEHCGDHTCLEDTFPDCLSERDGRVIRTCSKCRGEINPAIGEWVAKKPGVTDKRGYHYSQLFSQFVDPAEILHQFRTTSNRTDFYNLKIGNAYVEAENRLSMQEILALCSNDGIASYDSGLCCMGVDQGKDLHVVIGKSTDTSKIIHLGIYKEWEELDRLMKIFNVARCIVDALPETRNARAFADRFKGRIYLNYYNDSQRGRYSWNEKDMVVICNRTESLDNSHNEIMQKNIILPKECEIVNVFAKHCSNVAKKLEEDEETGNKRYVYVKLGEDHFRHAYNYECMARTEGAGHFWYADEFDYKSVFNG